jgi:retron-type reverse transcriptase
MKRHGHLFDQITSLDNLALAYDHARKGKTWQRQVKTFSGNAQNNLIDIRQSLVDKTFHTSSYKVKIIHEPKKRQIYILPFSPDRIVQHALMNIIEPIWNGLFIEDSYACRKNKGIHAGSRRTMDFVRHNKYCLQCDISKFYPSIDHNVLSHIVSKKIKCPDTLWLLKDIIHSIEGDKNAPIGNYTSQWFGNLYMNELDQYLKHTWRIRDYIRYCDDFILFHNDKSFLQRMKAVIKDFLSSALSLTMSKCEVFPVSQGVDFLGYRHFPGYILLRKTTAKRIIRRYYRLPLLLDIGKITLDQFRSSIASMSGWMKWAQTRNLEKMLRLDELQEALFAA